MVLIETLRSNQVPNTPVPEARERTVGHCPFIPPFPRPLKSKASLIKRFFIGSNSWIHTLFERSYTMKMGSITLPRLKFFIINDLPLATQVLDDAQAEHPKHELLNDMLHPLLGNSVFLANGAKWADQRQMINPAFAHTNLARAFPAMAAATQSLIGSMQAADLSRPVDVDPLMTQVTADIIFRTLFSLELGQAAAARVYAAFNTYQKYAQRCTMLRLYGLPSFGFARAARRAAGAVHAVFEPIIRQRLSDWQAGQRQQPGDILETLMEARHPRNGEPFTLADLVDQASVIFLAGHETSASALSWTLYLLAQSPALQDELHAALEAETAGGPISLEHLRRLEPLRNVFKEALRLYPPVSFLLRGVTRPTTMRGKAMAAGDLIVVSPWLIQRNPDNWPCPHSFDPERFARPQEAMAAREAWLPFGKGARVCVGAGFAQQEAALVLANIIRQFRLSCPDGFQPELVSRLTLRPKSGIPLTLMPR